VFALVRLGVRPMCNPLPLDRGARQDPKACRAA